MNVDISITGDQNIDLAIKSMRDALAELQKDKEFSEHIFKGSSLLGVEEIKVDGRIILRGKIITLPAIRDKVSRQYRYLVLKKFEKNKIAIV